MRILVTGSRDWALHFAVQMNLTDSAWPTVKHERVIVVHGDCPKGADRIAKEWVRAMRTLGFNVREEAHPADWERWGKAAGFRRNEDMVNAGADLCLAFIRYGSKGATHTTYLARKAGIATRVFREDEHGNYLGEDK